MKQDIKRYPLTSHWVGCPACSDKQNKINLTSNKFVIQLSKLGTRGKQTREMSALSCWKLITSWDKTKLDHIAQTIQCQSVTFELQRLQLGKRVVMQRYPLVQYDVCGPNNKCRWHCSLLESDLVVKVTSV